MGLRSILRSCQRRDGPRRDRHVTDDDGIPTRGRTRQRAASPVPSPAAFMQLAMNANDLGSVPRSELNRTDKHQQRSQSRAEPSSSQHGGAQPSSCGDNRRPTTQGSEEGGAWTPGRQATKTQGETTMENPLTRQRSTSTRHVESTTGSQASMSRQSTRASSGLSPHNVNALTNPSMKTGDSPSSSVHHGNTRPSRTTSVSSSSSPLLRRIPGSSTPMTRAQVREVIATIGQLFPHMPYAVCGHSAMMWYGDTPLQRPSHISLVCLPDSLAPMLRWAVAKGLALCDRWPGREDGGGATAFCVPTAADGVPRAVRVHADEGLFTTLRAISAPKTNGARVLTLPSVADAVAGDYIRALAGDDCRGIVVHARDVFWLLRKMAQLRPKDGRQALTAETAPTFASVRFLQPFTASHVYSVDLIYRAGLNLSRIPGLELPPVRVRASLVEGTCEPSSGDAGESKVISSSASESTPTRRESRIAPRTAATTSSSNVGGRRQRQLRRTPRSRVLAGGGEESSRAATTTTAAAAASSTRAARSRAPPPPPPRASRVKRGHLVRHYDSSTLATFSAR
ncbi:hypothetical protein JDV02_009149 [Purpureocillium takamizusanense]|uniref:Uncharacterized protein n=1 Tax=Purpureocillium takamizusanense TaxID=2060973 RepID=A0A9Q8QLH8_9HYPO|nr:uncharacterized protein JDV02_009149 [Purpureocillium takamizusanense]UNI23319.1 hypothetical protein JDV02_009149 [Purpureocillium takamizusanense]